jgi:hypothetical protein
MAGSPVWKIYNADGKYEGSLNDPSLAGAVVALLGKGSSIRYQHGVVCWREGVDGDAGESYDAVAEHCDRALHLHRVSQMIRQVAKYPGTETSRDTGSKVNAHIFSCRDCTVLVGEWARVASR